MEAQRAVRRTVDDLRRKDRGDESEHIQIGFEPTVLGHQVGNRGSSATEEPVAKQGETSFVRLDRQRIRAAAVGRCVHPDNLMPAIRQPHEHVFAEGSLTEKRDSQSHCSHPT